MRIQSFDIVRNQSWNTAMNSHTIDPNSCWVEGTIELENKVEGQVLKHFNSKTLIIGAFTFYNFQVLNQYSLPEPGYVYSTPLTWSSIHYLDFRCQQVTIDQEFIDNCNKNKCLSH